MWMVRKGLDMKFVKAFLTTIALGFGFMNSELFGAAHPALPKLSQEAVLRQR